jgi:hypothetical protein
MANYGSPVETILNDAYRELNIVSITESSPTPNQLTEGLDLLNSIIRAVYGFEIGELLVDWQSPWQQQTSSFPSPPSDGPYIVPALNPPRNSRVVWGGTTQTLYFPQHPENGTRMSVVQGSGVGSGGSGGNVLTIDGNGRSIGVYGANTATLTFNTITPAFGYWYYSAEFGIWVPILDLLANDNMPFTPKWDQFWTVALAIRVAPRYNKTVSQETVGVYKETLDKLKMEFSKSTLPQPITGAAPSVFSPVWQIIYDAYREANIIEFQQLAPTANQLAEGLNRLNRIIKSVYGFELGEPLVDWQAAWPQRTAPVAANYPQAPYPITNDPSIMPLPIVTQTDLYIYPYPPKNSRIVWGGTAFTLYFPEQPENGSRMSLIQGSGAGDDGQNGNVLTIDANGRQIGAIGTDTVEFTFNTADPVSGDWIYHADLGLWTPIVDLGITDVMPFPSKWDQFWIAALAIRLAPAYGKSISVETQGVYAVMLDKMRAAFRQSQVTIYGSYEFPRSLQTYIAGRWFY